MIKNLFSFLFLIIYCATFCQGYSSESYDTDNGLPQNSVKDIVKDKYGFIWLTTENGIVKYDGLNFFIYKNFPLNNQRFTKFYGDIEHDSIFTIGGYSTLLLHKRLPIIIKNENDHSNIMTVNNTKYFLYNSGYTYNTTLEITKFYIPFEKGNYFISEGSLRYKPNNATSEKNIQIESDYDKFLSFFAIDQTLFLINYKTKKLQEINDGKITATFDVPLLTDIHNKIYFSKINNQVFVFNNKTIYTCKYDNHQLKISKLITLEDLTPQKYISIYYDEFFKKLYLGSGTEGLQVINFYNFYATKKPGPSGQFIFYSSIPYNSTSVITPTGEIYDKYGFVDDKNFRSDNSFFIDYDHDKNIFIRNVGEVKTFKKLTSYKDFDTHYFGKKILIDFIYDDKKNYALFAVPNKQIRYNGIVAVYKDRAFKSVDKSFLLLDEPTTIKKINDETLLVGTLHGLLKISLLTNKIYNLTGKYDISVRNIIQTKDGNFWVTTLGKGFYLLKNNRLIKMPYDLNKNLSSPHTLLEDDQGYFWISTNNGLYKVLEKQLLNFAKDNTLPVYYYRFSKESGFNTNEFNGGGNICGNILENGDFVFPSLKGLVFFNPSQIKTYYPKELFVERAIIDDEEIYFKDDIHVTQKSNRIDILIDIPYYSNSDNVIIYAKIADEANTRWVLIGKDRKFSISNLEYGNHKILVKMLTSGRGKFIYKKIHIIIPPYYYQTIWFRVISAVLIILLLYLLIKWRINFLKKKNNELENIISLRTKKLSDTVESLEQTKVQLNKEIEQQKKLIGTITHDITTPVKFIALTAKELLDRDEYNKDNLRKILGSIHKSSFQLYNFTKTIKEYSDIYSNHRSHKTRVYPLYKLIEEKKILFDEIAVKNDTVIINNVSKKTNTQIGKNILAAIIHNLLDNSVKYTHNGLVEISDKIEGENLLIQIIDTGCGLDEQKIEYYTKLQDDKNSEKLLLQKYGMGLHLVLELLQMIEGKIIIRRNECKGTTFILVLKNNIGA